MQRGRSTTGRRTASTSAPILAGAREPVRGPDAATAPVPQDHGLDKALDQELIRLAQPGHRRRHAGRRSSCRSATSTAPSARCSAPRSPAVAAATGLPDGTIDVSLTRLGRAELRRVRAARHHAAARGRRQRLLRQGPVGRAPDRAARPRTAPFVAEDNIIAGNVIALRRHRRRGLPPRHRRRAVLRAQLRRHRGGRGRRRPRLRVHDRRAGGGARRRPAATSRAGMSGGIAYVYDRDGHVRPRCVNYEMVELEHARRRRPRVPARDDRASPRAHRLDGRRAPARELGERGRAGSAR